MAVGGVNLDVQPGEIVAVVGPNGAGKTTMFSCVSGSLRADGGRVVFDGTDITNRPAHVIARSGLVRTFQLTRLFPSLTTAENVIVGGLHGVSSIAEAREIAERCLEEVGLLHAADVSAGLLTLGMRKQLELARALALSPRLLLLDEIMAGLSRREIEELSNLILALRDRGLTILWIEHIMSAVRAVADRVVVLHHGRMLAEGTFDEVTSHPEVIKAYLGGEVTRGVARG